MSRESLLRRAVRTYGEAAQSDMMVEEMSELTKALLKLRRAPLGKEWRKAAKDVREEMADVQIMLDQMKIIHGDIREVEEAKLARLEDRLNKKEELK